MTYDELKNLESNYKKNNIIKISYNSIGFKTTKHQVVRTLYKNENIKDENVKGKLTFKYKEEIKFKKPKDETNKFAICIGYNPAKADKEIDVTNKRLIDLLWENYDGYTLYNLYPQVSSNKTTCVPDLNENQSFLTVIVDIIKKEENDIIIFWGRTVSFDESIKNVLETRILDKNKKIFITVYNNQFTHPAANAKIELKELQGISTTYSIK